MRADARFARESVGRASGQRSVVLTAEPGQNPDGAGDARPTDAALVSFSAAPATRRRRSSLAMFTPTEYEHLQTTTNAASLQSHDSERSGSDHQRLHNPGWFTAMSVSIERGRVHARRTPGARLICR